MRPPDVERRMLLRGAALTAAGAGAGALATQALGEREIAQLRDGRWPFPGPPLFLPDRAALAAIAQPVEGQVVFLSEEGREGFFRCVRGHAAAADPLQGLSVPGNGVHFARVWDDVHGRPEWFGAKADDDRADCADAIEACYALCPVTQLRQADYHVRRTIRFAINGRTVRGVGNLAYARGQGTRIVLHRDAPGIHGDDIVLVGALRQPAATSESFVNENHLSHLTLVRDGACAPHPSGDLARFPAGLRAAFVVHSTFREVTSLESSVGFYVGGVVYTKLDDCVAQRTTPGTTPANDRAVGFYLDGRISFGYAGGNASVYLNRCLAAEQHRAHADPVGLLAQGAFVDTFLDHFESARIATGIAFRLDGARAVGQSVDVHIRNPVLDGCSRFGIDIDLDATSSASVEIVDPYIYAAGGGADRGILVHGGAGLVTMTGGQVHGAFAGGSLWFSRTRGIRVQGVKIHQATRPVVVDEASALLLEPQINNVGLAAPGFAIACRALSRSVVRPIVIGAAGGTFRGGVSLDRTSQYVQVDGSAIDPGCFGVVDAGRKVWFDGVDMRRFGGRPAVEAAHNMLVGVTD